ncbi:MAG: CAP domain-containing protein [Oscillospiraceae bacterium]|jgi:hypothetical protein|nr:CAP domain-containing protein [Oscillospiraceae bacterium]
MKRIATYLFALLTLSCIVIFNASASSAEPSAYEWEVFDLVNAARAENGLPALQFTAEAYGVSQLRAKEVLSSFAHTRPNGTYFSTAFTELNVTYSFAAENIAYGQSTPSRVVSDWLNSPGHYANIMSTSVQYIGISYVVGQGNSPAWAQEFYSPNQWNGGTVTVLSRNSSPAEPPPVVVTPPPVVVTPPPVVVTPPPVVEIPPIAETPTIILTAPERGFFPSFMRKATAVSDIVSQPVVIAPPKSTAPPVNVSRPVPQGFFPSFMYR